MKNPSIYFATVLAASALTLAGCSSTATPATSQPAQGGVVASGAPSGSAVLPVAVDPIQNAATASGLTVSKVMLEDNTDASGTAIGDRLQFVIGNDTSTPLTGLEAFYTMTDATTGATESYYQSLDGLTVPAKGSIPVYFDNDTGAGHFPENKFSLYRSSLNQVDFAVEVSAPGLKIATGAGSKSAGAGEQAD